MTGSRSVQNIAQRSLGDFALPSISSNTLCSFARVGLMKRRYRGVNNVWNAFRDVEGDKSNNELSDPAC